MIKKTSPPRRPIGTSWLTNMLSALIASFVLAYMRRSTAVRVKRAFVKKARPMVRRQVKAQTVLLMPRGRTWLAVVCGLLIVALLGTVGMVVFTDDTVLANTTGALMAAVGAPPNDTFVTACEGRTAQKEINVDTNGVLLFKIDLQPGETVHFSDLGLLKQIFNQLSAGQRDEEIASMASYMIGQSPDLDRTVNWVPAVSALLRQVVEEGNTKPCADMPTRDQAVAYAGVPAVAALPTRVIPAFLPASGSRWVPSVPSAVVKLPTATPKATGTAIPTPVLAVSPDAPTPTQMTWQSEREMMIANCGGNLDCQAVFDTRIGQGATLAEAWAAAADVVMNPANGICQIRIAEMTWADFQSVGTATPSGWGVDIKYAAAGLFNIFRESNGTVHGNSIPVQADGKFRVCVGSITGFPQDDDAWRPGSVQVADGRWYFRYDNPIGEYYAQVVLGVPGGLTNDKGALVSFNGPLATMHNYYRDEVWRQYGSVWVFPVVIPRPTSVVPQATPTVVVLTESGNRPVVRAEDALAYMQAGRTYNDRDPVTGQAIQKKIPYYYLGTESSCSGGMWTGWPSAVPGYVYEGETKVGLTLDLTGLQSFVEGKGADLCAQGYFLQLWAMALSSDVVNTPGSLGFFQAPYGLWLWIARPAP